MTNFFSIKIIIIVSILIFPMGIVAQLDTRIVRRINYRNEPVKILKTKIKDKEIKLDEIFSDGEDWLGNLAFDVENISSHTILHLKIHIAFPKYEIGKPTTWASDDIWYNPEPQSDQPFTANELTPPLKPGDKATITIKDYNQLRQFLDKVGQPKSIKEVIISIGQVFYEDGTMWDSGQVFYRDPSNPDIWHRQVRSRQVISQINSFFFSSVVYKRSNLPQTNECRAWIDTINGYCTGGVCKSATHVYGDEVLSPNDPNGYKFRIEDTQCKDSLGNVCSMIKTTFRQYIQCGTYTAGCNIPENGPVCIEQREECEGYGGIWKGCCKGCISPIVIDVAGNGFNLTDGNNGVLFDLLGDGIKDKLAWIAPGSDDAWLALDRNHNGTIDNATELFGNFTEQPDSIPVKDRNGFYALAVFDQLQNGGNGDGKINRQDRVYNDLRLWQDLNHNGISEPNELHTLDSLDVKAILLDFQISRRTDEFGNRFKYKARVRDRRDADVGKFAWDVFPVKPR